MGLKQLLFFLNAVYAIICPRSLAPFYIVSHYVKWIKTSGPYRSVMVSEPVSGGGVSSGIIDSAANGRAGHPHVAAAGSRANHSITFGDITLSRSNQVIKFLGMIFLYSLYA